MRPEEGLRSDDSIPFLRTVYSWARSPYLVLFLMLRLDLWAVARVFLGLGTAREEKETEDGEKEGPGRQGPLSDSLEGWSWCLWSPKLGTYSWAVVGVWASGDDKKGEDDDSTANRAADCWYSLSGLTCDGTAGG